MSLQSWRWVLKTVPTGHLVARASGSDSVPALFSAPRQYLKKRKMKTLSSRTDMAVRSAMAHFSDADGSETSCNYGACSSKTLPWTCHWPGRVEDAHPRARAVSYENLTVFKMNFSGIRVFVSYSRSGGKPRFELVERGRRGVCTAVD